jgi:hypothetical protein
MCTQILLFILDHFSIIPQNMPTRNVLGINQLIAIAIAVYLTGQHREWVGGRGVWGRYVRMCICDGLPIRIL